MTATLIGSPTTIAPPREKTASSPRRPHGATRDQSSGFAQAMDVTRQREGRAFVAPDGESRGEAERLSGEAAKNGGQFLPPPEKDLPVAEWLLFSGEENAVIAPEQGLDQSPLAAVVAAVTGPALEKGAAQPVTTGGPIPREPLLPVVGSPPIASGSPVLPGVPVAAETRAGPLPADIPHAVPQIFMPTGGLSTDGGELADPVVGGAGHPLPAPGSVLQQPAERVVGDLLNPGNRDWGNLFSQRVMLAVNQGLQRVEIQISPPHLGPIEVQVRLHHDSASVQLISPHPVVRDALHDALPKLQQLFEEQGLNLAQDSGVHDSSTGLPSRDQGESGGSSRENPIAEKDAVLTLTAPGRLSLHQVDEFA